MRRRIGDGGALTEPSRVDELERRVAALPDELQAAWVRDLDRLQSSVTAQVHALASRVDEVLTALGADPTVLAAPTAPSHSDGLNDAFYAALEDRFRGSTDDIGTRQQRYVDDIRLLPATGPVLDLGCGRGEFLTVLGQHGIDAVGVDTSEVAVADCRAAGLEVRRADLLEELERWPSNSLRAVSLLQVAEHLPFATLLRVLGEARRALVPGGLLLAETPNGANLLVAASTFWLDPTHIRPIHPLLLGFIAERAGFNDIEVRGSSSSMPPWRLADDRPATPETEAIRGMQSLLLDDQDVTLFARVAA